MKLLSALLNCCRSDNTTDAPPHPAPAQPPGADTQNRRNNGPIAPRLSIDLPWEMNDSPPLTTFRPPSPVPSLPISEYGSDDLNLEIPDTGSETDAPPLGLRASQSVYASQTIGWHERLSASLDKGAAWDDQKALARDVSEFVKAGLAGKTGVVLIGESHDSITSFQVRLAAMKAVHDVHGSGAVVMFESTPEWIGKWANVMTNFVNDLPPKGDSEAARTWDRTYDEHFADSETSGERIPAFMRTAMHFAKSLGFEVTGFDTRRPLPGEDKLSEAREQAMLKAIREQKQASDAPVIVFTGELHVPELHARLDTDTNVVALSVINSSLKQWDGERLARASYLLSHPKIFLHHVASKVADAPVGYLNFASQLGVDVLTRAQETAVETSEN